VCDCWLGLDGVCYTSELSSKQFKPSPLPNMLVDKTMNRLWVVALMTTCSKTHISIAWRSTPAPAGHTPHCTALSDRSVCLSVTHAQLFYLNADQLLLHCITQLTPESRFQEKSLTNWTIGLPSRILGLDCTQWVLAFLSRSSIYAYFFAFAYKC